MKLSARGRYGVRILMDIARHQNQGPAPTSDISLRQGISVKYLDQLLPTLKKADLVKSVRGPKGGYLLSRPAEEISVGEVVSLMERHIQLTECASDPGTCDRSDSCTVRRVWQEATQALLDKLNSISIASLMKTPEISAPAPGQDPCRVLGAKPQEGRQ